MIAWLLLRPRLIAEAALIALLLLAVATSHHYRTKAAKLQHALQTSEVARAVAIQIWKGEIDRLTDGLAKADTAAKVAITAKVSAEQAAAKKLAATNRKWKALYDSKPENRAWAETTRL